MFVLSTLHITKFLIKEIYYYYYYYTTFVFNVRVLLIQFSSPVSVLFFCQTLMY